MTVPTPGPFAVVRMGRSNAAGFILLAIFLGVIVGVAAISSANSDDSSERAIGFGIAGLFALPLILLIILAPRFLAPASVVLDPYGLRLRMGGREHIIAWPLIAGIGIGYAYQQQPGRQPLSLSM